MNTQPSQRHQLAQGKQFWIILLILALACLLGLSVPGYLRRREADRTVDLLQPVISRDARLSRVMVWRSKDNAVVGGVVASESGVAAVKQLVREAQPTQDVVRVDFVLELIPGLR